VNQPDQKITRTQRGEEQPVDKQRAQTAHRTDKGETSPTREATRNEARDTPSRSGHD
jgi:hypothetical protein